jgi:alpha/beta superfamily hydrolase
MTAIPGPPGIQLETRWDVAEDPARAAVLCHPHPLAQGSMRAPLMAAIAKVLVRAGFAVLRFNFRGVGLSTGRHDYGIGELDDVAAAYAHGVERFPELSFGIAGWSFGAAVALRWQARDRVDIPYVGIAPPVLPEGEVRLPEPESLPPAPRSFIVGDRDQMIDVGALTRYAAAIGAPLHLLEGSDHFFHYREQEVGRLVASDLGAEGDPLGG